MENRISKLKTDFNNITTTRSNVKNIFDILQTKIHKLKSMYSEFISNSKTQLFVFGLDSFHFQSKLIDIEYDDMKRLFLAINNRMYCEYFKLYKIIVEYIIKNVVDKKISEIIKVNNFPIYKDLEPFKEYKFELVLELHENILILLTSIISNLNSKENELILHQSKKNIGLNIDNFITSFNYEIIMMREKVIMFLTYIEFFHKLHTKYLKRFNNKIQLMYTNINNDIKFDESVVDESTIEIINDEITTENLSIKNINTNNTNNTNELNNNIGYSVPRSPTSSVHSESDDSNHSKISGISNVSDKMLVESKPKTIGGMLKNGINRLLNSCNTIIKESVIDKVITNTEISTVFANIENTCETILSNKIEAISENIEIQIEEVQTQIEEKVEEVQTQIEDKVEEVQTQIEDKVEEVQTQIEKTVEEVQTQIEEKVEEVQTQIEEKVEEVQTQIEKTVEEVQTQIEKTVEDIQLQIEEVQNQIEETVEEVQTQIEETQTQLEEKVEEAQTHIEEKVEESQNKVDHLVNEMIEEVKEVENSINDDLSVLTEDLNSVTKEDQKTEEEVAKEPKKKRVYKSRKK